MRGILFIYLFIVCLFPLSVKGQDIHFSQPDVVPALFNPAYTGFFTGDFRFGLIYRNQWATVSHPFQTYGLTAELVTMKRQRSKDGLGIGVSFLGDVAGTLNYGTNQGNLGVTYFKSLSKYNNHFLSIGLMGGFGQAGFREANLVFGQSNSSNQESFKSTSEMYFDFSTGLAWHYQPSDILIYRADIAAFHLNQPKLTYLNTKDSKIWMRYLGHFRLDIRAWDDYAVIPSLIYQHQYNSKEIIYGGDFKWFVDESSDRFLTFSAGLYFRQMDAFIIALKSEYRGWLLCLSYDANMSGLRKSSHTFGAIELSAVYTYQKVRGIRRKEVPCPVF